MRRAIMFLAVCSLLGVFIVTGCDQGVNTPNEKVLNPITSQEAHSVTGDGWIKLDGSSTEEAIVTVMQTDDGRVDGTVDLEINRQGVSGSSDLVFTLQKATCLKVEGNSAWIRSEIIVTSHPNEELFKVGAEYITLIRDFGDKGTDIMHSSSLKEFQREYGNLPVSCSDKPTMQSMETVVSGGRYQVR